MAKLKDWDIKSTRNLNLPSASKNISSPPSKNGYLSKIISYTPAVENGFPSATRSYGFPSASENMDSLPANDNDRLTFKNKDTLFASKMPLVSKRKYCKLKKEVPAKKPKFSMSNKPITLHMEKFISSATDQNIFKSERTYAKKSISPASKDALNCNVDKSTANSRNEVVKAESFQTPEKNASSPLKRTNGFVDSENNINNVPSEDVKHRLFSDIFFPEYNGTVLECSSKLESADSVIKEQLTSKSKNGYQRTRKNLKIHLGAKRKINYNIEQTPTVKKSMAVKTLSEVTTKKILNQPPLKKVNSRKSNKLNTISPTVRNETGLPIVLKENDTLEKVEVQNCKATACVSTTVRKLKTSKSSDSDIIRTDMQTYSTEQGRKKTTSSTLGSSSTQSCSNIHSKGEIKISSPKKRVSILDIVKELSCNQLNQMKEVPHLQSKDSTPKSTTNGFEINVLDYPACKTNSFLESKLSSNEVNKLENSSCLQGSFPDKMSHLLCKDISPASAVSEFESNTVKNLSPKPVSSKKCNLKSESDNANKLDKISPCLQNNPPFKEIISSSVMLNSIEEYEEPVYVTEVLSLEKQILHTSLSEMNGNGDKCLLSAGAKNCTSILKRQQPVASLIKTGRKKRAISFDGDLSTAEHPQLSNCVAPESNLCAKDIKATKKYPLVKQCKKNSSQSPQKHSVHSNTEKNWQNSALPAGASVLNFTKQKTSTTSPNKLSSPHVCTKTKLLYLPFLVCDCSNPNSSSHNNTDLLLSEQINSFTTKIVCMAKKNPQKLHSLASDTALNAFCKKVEKLFLQNEADNNFVLPDPHLPETYSSTSTTELCNSLSDDSCNMDLETDLQMQSTALNGNLEANLDTQNPSEAFDFNFKDPKSRTKQTETSCDLDSETDIRCQSKSFVQKAFDQINFIHNRCITQLMFDYIGNCDAFELQASVQHFCDDPETAEGLSEFLFEIEEQSGPSFTAKVQYKFPINFQNLPLFTVIKDYIKYFIFKIYPLNCESVTSQSVLNFANENMSASDIAAVSCFFKGMELLKPTDFLSRFTCVAIVAIYKEYHRRKESISS